MSAPDTHDAAYPRETDSAGDVVEYRPLRDVKPGDEIAGGWKPWAVVERVEIDGKRGRVYFTTHGPGEWFPLDTPFPVAVRPAIPADDAEMWCERCGRRHGVVWFARPDLWNAVMREGDRGNPDEFSFCCPICFMQLAEERGVVTTGWLVAPEETRLPALLDALLEVETFARLVADHYATLTVSGPVDAGMARLKATLARLDESRRG